VVWSEVGEYATDVFSGELDRSGWDGVAAGWGGDVFGDPPSLVGAARVLDRCESVMGGQVSGAGGEFLDACEDALGQGSGVLVGRPLERFGEVSDELLVVFEEAECCERVGGVSEEGLCEREPFVGASQLGSVQPPAGGEAG
jgi:hypothetical protein